jgi:methionyl-tRNA formyltransferase
VAQVAEGRAEFVAQTEVGASFQGLVDAAAARIDWSRPGEELDRLIRGCDPQPGALADLDGVPVRLYGEKLEQAPHGAEPGTILEPDPDAGRLRVAAAGDCILTLAKLKLGDAKKGPALEAGIAPGRRLT